MAYGSIGCDYVPNYDDSVMLLLQEHVQKVFQKQESMEEMFRKRQVSLKKLAAKQTRPVQPVAPRPEAFVKSPCTSPGKYLLWKSPSGNPRFPGIVISRESMSKNFPVTQ